MDNENQNHSEACLAFAYSIAHPNERTLAKEILEGKKVGEFSLDFDQEQVDLMTNRLKGGGCFGGVVSEEEEVAQTSDDTLEAPLQDEAQPEAPVQAPATGVGLAGEGVAVAQGSEPVTAPVVSEAQGVPATPTAPADTVASTDVVDEEAKEENPA